MKFSKENSRLSRNFRQIGIVLAAVFFVSACNDTTDPAPVTIVPTKIFRLDATNLTANQPMSPVAVVLHTSGDFWQIGQPVSVAIETLAEGGDNSQMLQSAMADNSVSTAGILLPGASASAFITSTNFSNLYLSAATMLVNTNDAFSGINRIAVDTLAVGETLAFNKAAYDAGTESNSEMSGTIPGPADGGEGFNSQRDDRDFLTLHSGVVTQDDGLATSVLNESHRFDNPVILVKITRVQ
ncbi:MAG: spondin domain-containing protein [Enterobacterales bacterium]|nr:spondin domain-containing protein [Enterobacterales bacterium]